MTRNALLAALFAGMCGVPAVAAQLPRKAPELTITLPDGRSVKIGDYRGKVVALTFILTT